MNILLINPSSTPSDSFSEIPYENPGISSYIPINNLTLATSLIEKGHSVKVIDSRLYTSKETRKKLKLAMKWSELVGLSVMTSNIKDAVDISDLAKEKGITTFWSGSFPSLFPNIAVNDKSVDYVIVNEQEEKIFEIIRGTKKRVLVQETPMRDFPLPSYHLADLDRYINRVHKDGSTAKALDLQTSRGCPFSCDFCITHSLTGSSWRAWPAEKVISSVNYLIEKYNLDHIVFLDDNFFPDMKRTKSIIESLDSMNITWDADIRPDTLSNLSKDMLGKMKSSGCKMLSLGIESGSPRILKLIRKDTNPEQIIRSIEICRDYGFIPNIGIMMGIPTETKKEMKQTVKILRKAKDILPIAHFCGIQPFRPYPGGHLYEMCKERGLKEPETLRGWINQDKAITGYNDTIPWTTEKDFIDLIVFYLNHSRGSSNKLGKMLAKLSEMRWKHNFWKFPVEYILFKKYEERKKARWSQTLPRESVIF